MYQSQLYLADNARGQSKVLLQARLTDCLDLEAQLKQAHWNVKGKDFYQLHKLFDDLHGEVEDLVDTIAERLTAIGGFADGRVQTTARASSLPKYPAEAADEQTHLKAIAHSLSTFGASVRQDIDAAAGFGDATTADVFTEASRAIDKQLWLVEAHLAGE